MNALTQEAVGALRVNLIGTCMTPLDPGYEEHRTVYNAQIQRYPALIVVAQGAPDVEVAVRFARVHGLPVGIRGGGHSVAGHGTCDDGLLIDLRRMRGVFVDPENRLVWAQGGATLRDLDAATQMYGLVVPTGQVSATGVAGLTLGGGLGMLQRRFGLTCDNLFEARLVDAEGQMHRVNEQEDPELLWALRGGGGNFGVVTEFGFKAHRVGPLMLAGMIAWPVTDGEAVLDLLDRVISDAPLELSADIIFQKAPPLDIFPPQVQGRDLVGIFIRWSGEPADGESVVDRFRELPGAVLDAVGIVPLVQVQRMLDPLNPNGNGHRWTGEFLPAMDHRTRETLTRLGSTLPTPQSIIEVIPFNGAATDVDADATAFSQREDSWLIHILGQWADPRDQENVERWVKEARQALAGVGTGGSSYLNIVSEDETATRVEAFWDVRRRQRLGAVKDRLDPHNVFRFNHNIVPLPQGASSEDQVEAS